MVSWTLETVDEFQWELFFSFSLLFFPRLLNLDLSKPFMRDRCVI